MCASYFYICKADGQYFRIQADTRNNYQQPVQGCPAYEAKIQDTNNGNPA